MKLKFKKLSRQAHMLIFSLKGDEVATFLIKISPSKPKSDLLRELKAAGCNKVRSLPKEKNLMSVELKLSNLPKLNYISGVMYIKVAEPYMKFTPKKMNKI